MEARSIETPALAPRAPLPPPVAMRTAPAFPMSGAGATVLPFPRRAPQRLDVRLRYHGRGGELLVLAMRNVLFTLLTLGLYAPWAKAARRRYEWGCVEIQGDRLAYTGTGYELFTGRLKVAAVWAAWIGLPQLAAPVSEDAARAASQGVALALGLLFPFAVWGSRRYLLSRTTWRGIRFGLDPSARSEYVKTFLAGNLLTVLTLGLAWPRVSNRLHALLTGNSRYGDERFTYFGKDGDVTWIWLKGVALSILSFGVYVFWFKAELLRYRVSHTRFMGARGMCDLTGRQALGLALLATLGTLLTLGLAWPWISTYISRTVVESIRFTGFAEFEKVGPAAHDGSGAGDALGDLLDADLAI